MDTTEIQRIIKDYCKQLDANKMENLENRQPKRNDKFPRNIQSFKTDTGI